MAAIAYGPAAGNSCHGGPSTQLSWNDSPCSTPDIPVTAYGPGNRTCMHGCGLTWFPNPMPHRASSSYQGPHRVTPGPKNHRTQGSHSWGSSPVFMTVLPARSSHQASVYHKVVLGITAGIPSDWVPREISQKVNPRSTLSLGRRGAFIPCYPQHQR